MDDIHQLVRKFDALSQALDQDLLAEERRSAERLAREPSMEELRDELQLHEDALAIVAERHRELDARWDRALARRDHGELERLEAIRRELALEVPLLHKAIAALRQRLDAPPTATG